MPNLSEQPVANLVHVENLREFFMESVGTAMESNRLSADGNTAHYVVNLLTLFARAEAFHDPDDTSPHRKPLALMLADALDATTVDERLFRLQRLGDMSLFIAGFFADDLQRSVVDLDYYISMGGGAYSSLSQQSRGTFKGRAFGPVFAELGAKFHRFVDVLNDVRSQAGSSRDTDVMRLYEVWLKTGSARAERLLRRAGIHPLRTAKIAWEQ
jgi:hypothetical protein